MFYFTTRKSVSTNNFWKLKTPYFLENLTQTWAENLKSVRLRHTDTVWLKCCFYWETKQAHARNIWSMSIWTFESMAVCRRNLYFICSWIAQMQCLLGCYTMPGRSLFTFQQCLLPLLWGWRGHIALIMEAVSTSQISVIFQQTT